MIEIPDFIIFWAVYAILNGMVFSLYAYDKRKAKKNAWRIPENQLLFFALIGPFGAYGAMQVFRHKTQKPKFYLVPVFTILHIVIIIRVLISFMN
jgi:uncharacterized membrane protein YsdA (DUF1294 family)